MLASLAARVLSPVKPAPADPAPAPAAAAADAQSDATPTRPSLVRAASEDSALSELPEGDLDAPPAAKKARVSPAPEQEQLPTPSPSRSTASSSAAATKQRFSAAAPAGRSRTTRAGIADDEVATVDENPALGRDGKAYLTSGVYWSAALPTRPARRDDGQGAAPSSWRAVEPSKETAFPPPAFYGETLLDEDGPVAERGFRLPFDILRDFWYTDEAASRKGKGRAKGRVVDDAHLPVREGKGGDKTTEEDIARREKSKKPDPYRYISKNVYVGRGPDKSLLPAICACKKPARPSEMGCGQDCINRLMQYCCDPKKCPCGEQCGNPPPNKREGVPEGKDGLRVIWTGNRGFGLKTMVPIKEGEFVIEYRGEIISRDESYRRVLTDYKDRTS
ncbi:hypothetical protein Rhopal_004425-T1 [Rhodotorula paludigena]|uniref:AWS domain-containing protein n=1 Tax=Rhodotorula paludigena TaxID=86838 RepID=A0AAV5GLP3_9BASI|nr:hypothetical protein Rhopal_004425-T1 [Rhodotorula paludigena]